MDWQYAKDAISAGVQFLAFVALFAAVGGSLVVLIFWIGTAGYFYLLQFGEWVPYVAYVLIVILLAAIIVGIQEANIKARKRANK